MCDLFGEASVREFDLQRRMGLNATGLERLKANLTVHQETQRMCIAFIASEFQYISICFNMFDIHFVHLSCNNLFRFVDMIMEQLKLAVPRYLRE